MSHSKGVDKVNGVMEGPRATYCYRCGGKSNQIIWDGLVEVTLADGRRVYAPHGEEFKVLQELGLQQTGVTVQSVDPYDKVPSTEPCDTCVQDLQRLQREVAKGGVYFRCRCGKEGVITHSDVAGKIREQLGKGPYEDCGVTFGPENCVLCNLGYTVQDICT